MHSYNSGHFFQSNGYLILKLLSFLSMIYISINDLYLLEFELLFGQKGRGKLFGSFRVVSWRGSGG